MPDSFTKYGLSEPFVKVFGPESKEELLAKLGIDKESHEEALFENFMALHDAFQRVKDENLILRGQCQAFQIALGVGSKRHGRKNR